MRNGIRGYVTGGRWGEWVRRYQGMPASHPLIQVTPAGDELSG